MKWDASRPVPWQRMMRDWLVYVSIMFVIVAVFFRDNSLIGLTTGLLVSGPIYLAFGYVLAKFGYQRKSLRELRTQPAASPERDRADDVAGPRPKPAPTRRTGGGTGRPGGSRKRR